MAGQIPQFTSTAGYEAPPLPSQSPSAASTAASALADGMNRVSAAFADVAQAANHQAAASKAVQIDTGAALKIRDMVERYASDPDPITAPARFHEEATKLHQDVIAGAGDPLVAAYVSRNLTQRLPVAYSEVARSAHLGVQQGAIGVADGAVSDQSKLLAGARNEAEMLLAQQGIKQAIGSVLTTRAITPEQARQKESLAYTQAILSRATNDPAGATAMLARFKPEMDAAHVLHAEQSLKASGTDAAGLAKAREYAGMPGSGMAVAGAGWQDRLFPNVLQTESSGRQFDAKTGQPLTSSADPDSPVGIAQVKPSTAAEAAAKAGIAYDPAKLRNDSTYNTQIGRAYWNQLAAAYQNPVLTAAAYNAGPGKVDGWIKTYGDPRTGAISEGEWASRIPAAETRAYVRKVGALTGNPDQPHVNYGLLMARAEAELGDQPQLLAATLKHLQIAANIQQAGDADAARQEAIQQKAKRDGAQAAGNAVVQQLILDPSKVDPKAIADDPFLEWRDKHALSQMVIAAQPHGEDKDAKTYGPGFWQAYQAVHAADGDPAKITDPVTLYPRGGPGGDLTVAGIDKLAAEIAGRRTPDGEAEASMKKQFLAVARQQLTGANDLLHLKDPKGEQIFLRFMAAVLPAYDAGRKAGKSAAALLNPDSPDYVGKAIDQMKRPPAVFMKDMMEGNRDPLETTAKAETLPPEDNSQAGIIGRYRAGKLTREQAKKALEDGGFATPAAPTPAAPAMPSVPR